MTILDIVILASIAMGAVFGFKRGLVWQATAILGLVLGFFTAKHLYIYVAERYVSSLTNSPGTAQMIAFFGVWIIVPIVFSLAGTLLNKFVNAVALGGLNRFLGAILGAAKYMFFIGMIIAILDHFDTDNRILNREKKESSFLYYPLKQLADKIFPVIEKEVKSQYYIST